MCAPTTGWSKRARRPRRRCRRTRPQTARRATTTSSSTAGCRRRSPLTALARRLRSKAHRDFGTARAIALDMFSNRGVWPAWLWMFILALLLGWLPFIGPAIAGFVGGLQAGDAGSALVAAIIPSIIVAALIFLLGAVVGLP